MTRRRSKTESEIPLYLLPHAVARQIRERGDAVYRISVVRTHWHHYNVTVRTKPVPREIAPGKVAVLAPAGGPAKPVTGGAQGRGCRA